MSYSKIIHITCTVRGLHKVAETVRILNPKVNIIIINVKKRKVLGLGFKISRMLFHYTNAI